MGELPPLIANLPMHVPPVLNDLFAKVPSGSVDSLSESMVRAMYHVGEQPSIEFVLSARWVPMLQCASISTFFTAAEKHLPEQVVTDLRVQHQMWCQSAVAEVIDHDLLQLLYVGWFTLSDSEEVQYARDRVTRALEAKGFCRSCAYEVLCHALRHVERLEKISKTWTDIESLPAHKPPYLRELYAEVRDRLGFDEQNLLAWLGWSMNWQAEHGEWRGVHRKRPATVKCLTSDVFFSGMYEMLRSIAGTSFLLLVTPSQREHARSVGVPLHHLVVRFYRESALLLHERFDVETIRLLRADRQQDPTLPRHEAVIAARAEFIDTLVEAGYCSACAKARLETGLSCLERAEWWSEYRITSEGTLE